MVLPKAAELRTLLKVCREFGVENVEVGELKIKFGEMPVKQSGSAESVEPETMPDGTPLPHGVTLQQMIDYSAMPDPLLIRMGETA